MYKAYKFRMYPTDTQLTIINKNFGCKRFVYNHFLNKIKNTKKLYPSNCIIDLNNNLKKEYQFLEEIDNQILYKSIYNLYDNLKKHNNNNFGLPKFKSKYNKNSYTILASHKKLQNKNYCNIEIDIKNKLINLPILNSVKIRGYRNLDKINGKIKSVTISKEPTGKYYISILCELPSPSPIPLPKTIIGIDVGVKNLLTLSDGITITNNKYIEKYEKRIKRWQKALNRKQKGSNNYYKCKQKLAKLYSKLTNARKFYTHKITKKITDEYDIISCENLKTQNMIEQKIMSKQITDATLSEITRQLGYKAKWKGKYFYQIDTYYPSSQICSVCGNQDKKYKDINLRNYKCCICHTILDRDLNASINIMYEGLKQYMKCLK